MKKLEELSNPKSCMSRAEPDEMVFVLLARDEAAASAIRHWCSLRIISGKNMAADAQIVEALACADEMDRQREKRDAVSKIDELLNKEDSTPVHITADGDVVPVSDTPETDALIQSCDQGQPHKNFGNALKLSDSLERRLTEARERLDALLLRELSTRQERDAAVQSNDAYEQSNAGLKRMVIATEKDALRYRWLRSKAKRSLMTSKKHAGEIQVIRWNSRTEADVLSQEELDTIIDAALAEKGKP